MISLASCSCVAASPLACVEAGKVKNPPPFDRGNTTDAQNDVTPFKVYGGMKCLYVNPVLKLFLQTGDCIIRKLTFWFI